MKYGSPKYLAAVVLLTAVCRVVCAGPVFSPESLEVDLGRIPENQHVIVGIIPFRNTGDQTLEVLRVNGSCSCYKGYTGDTRVEPGDMGVLEVTYDKWKIPSGQMRRQAQIQTNDTANPQKTIYFDFAVARTPDVEDRYQMRSELEALRRELRLVRSDLRKVLAELEEIKSLTGKAGTAAKPAPRRTPDLTVYEIPLKGSPVLGNANAPITIVEFSDFQCSHCISEFPKFQQLLKDYPNDVKLVFKHYPLNFHKQARPVHAAAEWVFRRKGSEAFWQFHDKVLAQPKQLEVSQLRKYVVEMGLDASAFDQMIRDDKQITALIRDDLSLAARCKVTGTPTILINGLKQSDRSIQGYKKRIDQLRSAVNEG